MLKKCKVTLELRDLEKATIKLVPHTVVMEGETELTQYVITKWSLQFRTSRKIKLFTRDETDWSPSKTGEINEVVAGNPDDGIDLEIIMRRKIINELLTTYLPSVLILCIVYATNFFKPFFFEAMVTVNLTSQLVLTTLFISVSNSLPPTAYVKMIDVWLIFSQLIPFVSVLLHTLVDNMRSDGLREVNHHGQVRTIKNNAINVMEQQQKERARRDARRALYERVGEIAG